MQKQVKDLFIPHVGNGFKPNILERISLGIMLLLVLLSFAAANVQSLLWISSDFLVSTILPAVIVDLTNEERTTNTVGTLTRNSVLDAAATLKAEDMAKYSYFAHYSPKGVSPWYWFDQVSYNFVYAGENLAVHFTDSGDVVDAWMHSPSHRENILNGHYTEIGVGTARGEYKGYPTVFVVQLFGTPQAAPATETTQNITLETTSGIENQSATPQEVAQASIQTIPEQNLTQPAEAPMVVNTENEQVLTPSEGGDSVTYSDLATTARPGTPLTLDDQQGAETTGSSKTSMLLRTATQPSLWLQIIYGTLALFVVISLVLSIVIEWRKQHPVQIAYAGGLLAIMALLFYIHVTLTSGVTIV